MKRDTVIGRIFTESAPVDASILDISRLSGNKVKMQVILQDADAPNRNGRVYPKKVLEEALKAPFITEKLATNSLGGEMNHPEAGSSLQRQMTIDLRNISHFIKRIYWDTKNPNLLLGDIETSANSIGKDFAAMIVDNQMICSFSMRGGGDVTRNKGYDYVKSPLKIITWDAVHFPSHQKAYMVSRLAESASHNVTLGMLNEYIAAQSDNFGLIHENVQCFTNENLNINISEGNKIEILDHRGKPLAFSILETKLANEYSDALANMYRDI